MSDRAPWQHASNWWLDVIVGGLVFGVCAPLLLVIGTAVTSANGFREMAFGRTLATTGLAATATVIAHPPCIAGGMSGARCTIDYAFNASGTTVTRHRVPVMPVSHATMAVGTPLDVVYLADDPQVSTTASATWHTDRGWREVQVSFVWAAACLGYLYLIGQFLLPLRAIDGLAVVGLSAFAVWIALGTLGAF